MNDVLTGERIALLESLLAKATPGRLHAEEVEGCWCVSCEPGTPGGSGFAVDGECWNQADAALIAEAINALPALLQLARAVSKVSREMRDAARDEDEPGFHVGNTLRAWAAQLEGQTVALVPVPVKEGE